MLRFTHGGVIISVFPSIVVVNRGFEPRSGQTKDYKIGIWYFYAKHASTLMNQDNVSKWIDVLFQKASTLLFLTAVPADWNTNLCIQLVQLFIWGRFCGINYNTTYAVTAKLWLPYHFSWIRAGELRDYGCWCGTGGSGTPVDGIDT